MAQVYKDIIRLTIDLKTGVKEAIAPIKQADNLSRVLRCQLINNGKPINLKGSQLLLYVVKADYKQCVINGVINESKTGIVDFELTEQSLILAEEIQCEIVKIDEGDVLLSFPIFKVGIDGALYDNELVESTNEFSALTALISNVASWENRFVGECERIEKELDGKISKVNTHLSDVKNTMDVEYAKKSEVTNVLTPKGNESYLNLPKNNNNIGDYYYCNDGDSINGAGNYVWNGSEWYFGGTSDNGYSYVISEMDKRCKIKNYWNHESVVDGYYVHTSIVSNNNYCYIKIPVKYGDVVRCNNNMRFIAQQCTSTGSITSVENVKELTCNRIDGNGIKVSWVYISIPMGQKNNTIVTINDADLTYIDYGYYGKYLIAYSSERVLKNENITHLSKNKGRINNLGGYNALDSTYYTFTNFLKIKSKMTIDYILEGIVNTALISTYDCNKNLKRVFQSDSGVINVGTFETLDDECYIRFTTSTSYDNLLVLKYGDYEEETHFQYPNNLLLAKNLFKSGLFIGDSMTAYNGTIKKYPEFVRDFTGMKVDFSCAISGGNAVNVFSEKVFTKDFTDNDFDVCFIMLGTNGGYTDTLESDTDFESYLDYNSNATGSVCKIIEHVKANTTDITIFIVSIPVSNVSSGPNARLSNDVLQQIANKYDVGYLDIYNNGTINWGNLVNYTTEDDRVHRTSFGNATMADDVIRLMAEEFNKNPNRYKLLNSLETVG